MPSTLTVRVKLHGEWFCERLYTSLPGFLLSIAYLYTHIFCLMNREMLVVESIVHEANAKGDSILKLMLSKWLFYPKQTCNSVF